MEANENFDRAAKSDNAHDSATEALLQDFLSASSQADYSGKHDIIAKQDLLNSGTEDRALNDLPPLCIDPRPEDMDETRTGLPHRERPGQEIASTATEIVDLMQGSSSFGKGQNRDKIVDIFQNAYDEGRIDDLLKNLNSRMLSRGYLKFAFDQESNSVLTCLIPDTSNTPVQNIDRLELKK